MSGPRAFVITASIVLVAALCGYAAFVAAMPLESGRTNARNRPVWTETKWPFPIDQWGMGRAFKCKPADCGAGVIVYLRAKVGFCNCATGVADDEELERIGDIALVGSQSAALGVGQPIIVHRMKGRSRGYAVGSRFWSAKSVLSIAFNDRCDVVVVTAVIESDQPSVQEAAVLQFLNGDLVLRWAEATLGL